MLDIASIRAQFPILGREIYGKPLIYFDNAATSQHPQCVIDRISESYCRVNANVHRGVHTLSQEATEAHENARKRVQQYINARHSHEIIFTRGTTEAINLVAHSFGEKFLHDGDEVILTVMEHHSDIVPWQLLQSRKNIKLRVVPINERGELNMEVYQSLFNEHTRLVCVMHASNVLGTINPVEEMITYAHAHDVPVLVDGAQGIPHLAVDVQALDADFYVFSAHKVYGPTGIGVLYGKEKWLDAIPPYQGGGEMIAQVSFERTTFNELPYKFEAGTPDYVGSAAFATALDWVDSIGFKAMQAQEEDLLQYATTRLQEIDDLRIYGTAAHKTPVISFLVGNIHHYDMGMLLDKLGIAVRTGHHCAQPLMHALGIDGTVRASFAVYNTREEIDTFVAAVNRVANMLR
ncbi:MAG: cysteine desulfurase [Bacteroidaceae bacterium]|nr:cysteine desulfurase [Bacteroidaceae bacterium]